MYPGTRKAKTETFVVRSKKREDVLKRAVDIGGVEMVIEEKAKKDEVKVDVVKEKPAEPQVNRTMTKGQQIKLAYQLKAKPSKHE